jgi:hypothetical protein
MVFTSSKEVFRRILLVYAINTEFYCRLNQICMLIASCKPYGVVTPFDYTAAVKSSCFFRHTAITMLPIFGRIQLHACTK